MSRFDLLLRFGDQLFDARRDECGRRRSACSSEMRAISRRTGSNALTITTPGVSSMITSTPVAFSKARMLRPSRPMMRPFISSLGMSTVLVVALGRVRRRRNAAATVMSISLALDCVFSTASRS